MLLTACHRCNLSLKEAMLPGRNDAEMGRQTCYTLRRNATALTKEMITKVEDQQRFVKQLFSSLVARLRSVAKATRSSVLDPI